VVLHRHGDQRSAGEIVREEVIRPLGLSVTAAASALGLARQDRPPF
jgi:plasmid maintenance system antidote protein VapI